LFVLALQSVALLHRDQLLVLAIYFVFACGLNLFVCVALLHLQFLDGGQQVVFDGDLVVVLAGKGLALLAQVGLGLL